MPSDIQLQLFPNFGSIAFIRQTNWAAHSSAIRETPQLFFDTSLFPYFDRMVAESSRLPGLYNPQRPDYLQYSGLRINLAVLRNHVGAAAFGYSPFASPDAKHIPRLIAIAQALGDALANKTVGLDLANVEGVGAAEMYKHLVSIQDKPGSVAKLGAVWRSLSGERSRAFDLPPLENTPFSMANLIAGVKAEAKASAAAEQQQANPAAPPEDNYRAREHPELASQTEIGEKLADIAEDMMISALALGTTDEVEIENRAESVEEARKIFRWLRGLKATDLDLEAWLGAGGPYGGLGKAEKLLQLVNLYTAHLKQLQKKQPGIFEDPAVQEAMEVMRAMAICVGEQSLNLMSKGNPRAIALDNTIDNLPQAWEKRSSQSVIRLLGTLEAGMERVFGKSVSELNAAEKLALASQSLSRNAQVLRRVETLHAPAREESVQLARDILDKLKKMVYADKGAQEMIDSGRPEEKAAFAQRLDEGVESYKNIVAEVVQYNPALMMDKRIREANDAVGSFSHAVSLMAAKEMPSSVAAAQQISSAQVPAEWKNLEGRTVDRLLKSIEGGVEKAASELQRGDEQHKQELAEEKAAAQETAQDIRRRRRRGNLVAKGTGTARKQAIDLAADDMALKQGRFRETPEQQRQQAAAPPPSSLSNLRGADLEAIRELSGSLRNLSDDGLRASNVNAGDKIAPDDQAKSSQASRLESPSGGARSGGSSSGGGGGSRSGGGSGQSAGSDSGGQSNTQRQSTRNTNTNNTSKRK